MSQLICFFLLLSLIPFARNDRIHLPFREMFRHQDNKTNRRRVRTMRTHLPTARQHMLLTKNSFMLYRRLNFTWFFILTVCLPSFNPSIFLSFHCCVVFDWFHIRKRISSSLSLFLSFSLSLHHFNNTSPYTTNFDRSRRIVTIGMCVDGNTGP